MTSSSASGTVNVSAGGASPQQPQQPQQPLKKKQQRAFSFPKEVRLRRRTEFLKVQDKGFKITADCLLCLVLPNGRADGLTRLGLTVSTKVGPSVVRNRIRRRLRELFRVKKDTLPRSLDMVFIARNSAAEADFVRLSRSFERACAELHKKYPAARP